MDQHPTFPEPDGIRPPSRTPPRAEPTPQSRALVLGGGGVAGIAWEIGVLRGISDVAPDLLPSLTAADLIIGTSAGSVVAAQITSGISVKVLYAAQLDPHTDEIDVNFDHQAQRAELGEAIAGSTSAEHARQRIGALALTTHKVEERVRRAAVAARLPVQTWPQQRLMLTAVDAETGKLELFTRDSGVELIDAVAASCAVPGIWPPVTIGHRRYIDGGTRSATNADLAAGCDRVLIIAPSLDAPATPYDDLHGELQRLKPATVVVVTADAPSISAFGPNPLSPGTRAPAARAGRIQGQKHASAIAALWQ
jgi:NTE family protein